MRLALIFTVAFTAGIIYGCAAKGQGGHIKTVEGTTANGAMLVYDERQPDTGYYERQRSEVLEGNTR